MPSIFSPDFPKSLNPVTFKGTENLNLTVLRCHFIVGGDHQRVMQFCVWKEPEEIVTSTTLPDESEFVKLFYLLTRDTEAEFTIVGFKNEVVKVSRESETFTVTVNGVAVSMMPDHFLNGLKLVFPNGELGI